MVVCAADPLTRSGLVSVLRASGAFVAAEVADLRIAAAAAEERRATAVVTDLAAPASDPALARLVGRGRAAGWWTAVVVSAPNACDDARAAVAAGARVVLSRTADPVVLRAGLAAVQAGAAWVDPVLAAALLAPDAQHAGPALQSLTRREREVLDGIAAGLTNADLARAMVLSIRTIKFHVSNILAKLGLRSREEAIVVVHRHARIEELR